SLSRETAPVLSLLTSPSSTLTCEHDEIVITAYADGGVSPYTYSIDGMNFQTSNEFKVTEKGEKMLYVKDAKGCTSYNTINIEEDKVTPSLTVKQPEAVCYGLSVDLTQEEVAGYYYNYYNADKQLIASATVAEGGTYYVSKVNSANGCATELKPINVQIIEQPVLAFEVRQPQCSSDNGALIVSAVNSYSYEIDGVADADITSIEPGRHTVRAVSPEGCRSDAKTFTITKSFELPTFSAVITHPVCVGDLGAIRLVKDESYSYTINGELNGQLNNLPSGDYEIVVITPSGCESDGRVITVRESKVPQPTFSMDVTQPACGMLGKITVRKDESYRVLVNGMADAEMSNLVPGNYEVKVVSPEGCESEPQMAEISEGNGKFKSPVVHDYKACAEEGTIDLSTLVDESEGTLNWYAAASGSALTAFTSFNADAVQNKTYWVSQTDANGCESDRVRVRVEVLKNVDFDLPQDTVVCAGEALIVRLENKPVGSTAVWSESPSVIASNSSAIKLVPNVSETITATVSNGYCEKTKSMQITVADSQVSVTADTVLCGPSDLLLSAQGGETYEWTLADGTQLTDASEFEESVSASMRYVVKITNGRCVSHKTVNVEVVTVPEIDRISPAGAGKVSVVVKEGTQPYQFSVDGMEWQESNVLSNLEDGEEYEVQVIDGHHCQTSTTFVYEGDGLDIPMYFTPNGDGLNDLWEIGGIEKYPDIEIYIYDRFSKLLVKYKGNDWRGWDGFYLGKRMPSTDYWYLIIIPGRKDITGHFTLLNK
ncbi:MAG: T9SS type B sorting domain-containing protein, partial [Paludibacteraceae bacterium]|nr:T9SS type B sorting domain-containing protein [Paludibacteraceae bacterium]